MNHPKSYGKCLGVNPTTITRFPPTTRCFPRQKHVLVLGEVEEMEDEAEDLETAGNGSEPKGEDQA